MSRGVLLPTVRAQLKAELADTQETNTYADTEYNYRLANKQKDLALGYDWPFLEHKWDLPGVAGTRYYNIPTSDIRGLACTINFERPVKVEVSWTSFWNCVEYGITSDEMNFTDSDLLERLDPVRRWQLVTNPNETSNPDQVELWPIPASAYTVRFTAQRAVQALSAEADKMDLDDLLVVYYVAAEILALRNQPNAPLMLKKANDRLIKLRASYPVKENPVVFGKNLQDMPTKRLAPIIAVA